MNRRSFFLTAMATTTVAAKNCSVFAAPTDDDPAGKPSVERIVRRLKGPVVPINIPFASDYSVDYSTLRAYVDYLCESHIPVIYVTYGSSEMVSLSEKEIEAINRTIAEQSRGRSLVIGGTGKWWTGQSIDFIQRLTDSGIDGINLHLSTNDPDEVYRAFVEVSRNTELPLLGYDEQYPPELVARLADLPRVVGLKSHDGLYRYHDFIRFTKDKDFVIVGGGQMRNFLYGYLIGSQAYLCTFAPFAPKIAQEFYQALKRNDLDAARRVMYQYEDPLMKTTRKLGWGQSIKSILQLTGHFRTNLWRPPTPSHGPEEREELRVLLQTLGILEN